jgi:sulfatase maturation enzyme AslB (radical SAM superfamily)
MHITNENLDCCIVTLFIHNVCNYSCSYCSDFHRDGSYRWPEDWTPYLNFINDLKQRNKYLYIEVLGGEPTVWPQFQDFVDTISDDNIFVEFSTNASRTLRYWEQFRTHRAFVFLSWHYEETDDDHFYRVAEIMQHKASVSIPLMVVPDNYDRAVALYERLRGLNVEITPKFTRTSIHGHDYFEYTAAQREWIQNNYYNKMRDFGLAWPVPRNLHFDGEQRKFMTVLDQGLHRFEGYTCTAGIKRFSVDPNGDIKRCTKRVGGIIGNLFTGYTLPDAPIVCNYAACPCKLDAIV